MFSRRKSNQRDDTSPLQTQRHWRLFKAFHSKSITFRSSSPSFFGFSLLFGLNVAAINAGRKTVQNVTIKKQNIRHSRRETFTWTIQNIYKYTDNPLRECTMTGITDEAKHTIHSVLSLDQYWAEIFHRLRASFSSCIFAWQYWYWWFICVN